MIRTHTNGATEKLDKAFGNYNDGNNIIEILESKKETKENGFNTLKE